jgi:hypothetical protein
MAGDSLSDIQSLVPRNNVVRFMDAMKLPVLLSVGQAVLMVVYTTVFLSNEAAANFIYRNLYFFENYIPILSRYSALYAERGLTNDFGVVFSIHLFNVLLQGVALTVLAIVLCRNIRGKRPDRFGLKKKVLWFVLLLFLAMPSVGLVYGLDIVHPGLFSNAYVDCLTVPVFNLLIYFFLYARFWESYYALSMQRNFPIDELRR